MASEMSFVQTQLWVVIGLLVSFVASNILCQIWNRRAARDERSKPKFGEMFDKDELDELLAAAGSYLQTYPNDHSALYFSAQTLMSRGSYNEAHRRFKRIVELDPTMRSSIQPYLDETATAGDG